MPDSIRIVVVKLQQSILNVTPSADVIRDTGERMAKKVKRREWTKEDLKMLKTLARAGTKTTEIARKLKRTPGATRQQAFKQGVSLGGGK